MLEGRRDWTQIRRQQRNCDLFHFSLSFTMQINQPREYQGGVTYRLCRIFSAHFRRWQLFYEGTKSDKIGNFLRWASHGLYFLFTSSSHGSVLSFKIIFNNPSGAEIIIKLNPVFLFTVYYSLLCTVFVIICWFLIKNIWCPLICILCFYVSSEKTILSFLSWTMSGFSYCILQELIRRICYLSPPPPPPPITSRGGGRRGTNRIPRLGILPSRYKTL
jgi:hypothetical protein